jgi:hypothetical protein
MHGRLFSESARRVNGTMRDKVWTRALLPAALSMSAIRALVYCQVSDAGILTFPQCRWLVTSATAFGSQHTNLTAGFGTRHRAEPRTFFDMTNIALNWI